MRVGEERKMREDEERSVELGGRDRASEVVADDLQ